MTEFLTGEYETYSPVRRMKYEYTLSREDIMATNISATNVTNYGAINCTVAWQSDYCTSATFTSNGRAGTLAVTSTSPTAFGGEVNWHPYQIKSRCAVINN